MKEFLGACLLGLVFGVMIAVGVLGVSFGQLIAVLFN
jgi:hypothetical protein